MTRDRLAYSSYTKQLKEEEILIDMGFDVRNIRVYLIFGDNITPMLMETHIAMQMKSCFVFLGNLGIEYRVIFFRTNLTDDSSSLV